MSLRIGLIGAMTLAVLAGLAVVLFAPVSTYRKVSSPDGEFTAVAKASLFRTFIAVMPGQGGDKPGSVTLIRGDGRSCGSADVDMVSMVGDIRWRLDGKPREADIVATARWDLDACTVEIMGR